MIEWLPHILGLGIVAGVVVLMAVFPKSWGSEFSRRYGIRGTGPDGTMRRRDFLRSAALCVLLAVALAAIGLGFGALADKYPTMSRANWAAETYFFGCALLGSVALLCALIACWNAITWRPPTPSKSGIDEEAV